MQYQFTEHGDYIRAVIGDDAAVDEFAAFYRDLKAQCASRGVDRALVVVSPSGVVPSPERLTPLGGHFMEGFRLALVCAGWSLYRACAKAEQAATRTGLHVRAFFQETEGIRWLTGK